MFENNEESYGYNPENDGEAAENAKSKRFDEKEWDAKQQREGHDLFESLGDL